MRAPLLAAALLVGVTGPAAAHRGSASLSVVEIDAATGALTVTHSMAAHDVEPALVEIAPDAQPSVDDEAAMAALGRYAARAFRVWDAEGRPVPLVLRRTRLAGDDVTLEFTGRLPSPARALSVDSGLLEEARPDQENQVNVRRARVTRTVLFRAGDGPQQVEFD